MSETNGSARARRVDVTKKRAADNLENPEKAAGADTADADATPPDAAGKAGAAGKAATGKAGAAGGGAGGGRVPQKIGEPGAPEFPKTMRLALVALGAQVFFTIATALSFLGFHDQFVHLLTKTNNDAKKPKKPYTAADIAHDLHQIRSGQLIQAAVGCLALIVLALFLRRVRQAGVGRWALVVISILVGGPQSIIPTKDLPGLTSALRMGIGISALVMIVLLFVPQSGQFFRACREVGNPGGARPGLRDLFMPKGPRGAGGARGTGATGGTGGARAAGGLGGGLFGGGARGSRPAGRLSTRAQAAAKAQPEPEPVAPERPRSKSKGRADEAAIAKGAELARSRAKASKSRRTDG